MHSGATLDFDVVVLGAGPAGAVAALNLAPFLRVLVIDKARVPTHRLGETLPAAAARMLRDMDLFHAFQQQGHKPCCVIRGTWGGNALWEQNEMRNLDGHGWYLDRRRFDRWLRQEAQKRGAFLSQDVRLYSAKKGQGGTWILRIERAGQLQEVQTRFLIDASGRQARLGKLLGRRRLIQDKLMCAWIVGRVGRRGHAAAEGEIHAEPDGWWYSSPLPRGRRILAFFTDADIAAAKGVRTQEGLLARMETCAPLADSLSDHQFLPENAFGVCAAYSAISDRACDVDWLAVGDAALAFDPLSSQGVFNALYSGLAGATTVHACMCEGDMDAIVEYQKAIDQIARAYQANKRAWYSGEKRWPNRQFWRRRRDPQIRTHPP